MTKMLLCPRELTLNAWNLRSLHFYAVALIIDSGKLPYFNGLPKS